MNADETAAARAALRATSSDLLTYLVRRVPSPEDAADLLGETMLTAWRKIESMPEDPERQRMWLFVIAANLLRNDRRRSRRRLELTDRLRSVLCTTPTPPDDQETHAVRDAVLRLPAQHRELVMLVHWDGFSIAEAAELLSLNTSTARSRYAAARASLREVLIDVPG
ncbi:RNA polymerase sigma factor [Aeromicrobium sp.]|uniref:RNA polymerase sigma factor n=1 Tax=Aeromicrobium sp. TaxID=1871063 RepID=UPI003C677E29